jgi:acetyl-CoA carboxylase carboxyl transferase subunit beta
MIHNNSVMTCPKCSYQNNFVDVIKDFKLCENCDYHFRLNARERINLVTDDNSFYELFDDLKFSVNYDFPGYKEKIIKYRSLTGESEAFICGTSKIMGRAAAIGVLFSHFMMGSMGAIVGEKIKLLIKYADENKLPLVLFSASGGARMQEGIVSLMQMAKVSSALNTFLRKGNLYISVLTDPTTGGVAASFAYLGDYIIAEEGAMIGFAGQRVIKETINEDLPNNFQSAEFQLQNGFLDLIINRRELRNLLEKILRVHNYD